MQRAALEISTDQEVAYHNNVKLTADNHERSGNTIAIHACHGPAVCYEGRVYTQLALDRIWEAKVLHQNSRKKGAFCRPHELYFTLDTTNFFPVAPV